MGKIKIVKVKEMKDKLREETEKYSEELFIEHNISDIRTKRLVKDYYKEKILKRNREMEMQKDGK